MASTVSITIVGRSYEISCDDGQEDYLKSLAVEVDRRTGDLLRSVGQVGDARLLVMVALLMADEIGALRRQLAPDGVEVDPRAADLALAGGIDALARRIEAIADRLQSA
ncbi:MAG TPA: cell division protein ZapA [Rhodospirillaceae bacterium]|nr:cell division protein ZapA [Rhodospirillaceae bacterium]